MPATAARRRRARASAIARATAASSVPARSTSDVRAGQRALDHRCVASDRGARRGSARRRPARAARSPGLCRRRRRSARPAGRGRERDARRRDGRAFRIVDVQDAARVGDRAASGAAGLRTRRAPRAPRGRSSRPSTRAPAPRAHSARCAVRPARDRAAGTSSAPPRASQIGARARRGRRGPTLPRLAARRRRTSARCGRAGASPNDRGSSRFSTWTPPPAKIRAFAARTRRCPRSDRDDCR